MMKKSYAPPPCPHLGLVDDRHNSRPSPDPSHRCYRDRWPRRVDLDWQALFCLSDRYPGCPSDEAMLAPRRPIPGRRLYLVGIGGVLIVASVIVAWLAGIPGSAPVADRAVQTPTATAPRPTAPALPSATATANAVVLPPIPTPPFITPTMAPTAPRPSPTATPTRAQAGGRIHVVQPGETLGSIAAQYGVSVQAVARANGITNADSIIIGQRLVIP